MRDSTILLGDFPALRARYEEDGYLHIKGLLDPDAVLQARARVTARLQELGRLQDNTDPLMAQMKGRTGIGLYDDPDLQASPEVRETLESSSIHDFFAGFFGTAATTYQYKWLRAVGREEFTGAHFDSVYMGRGSQDLMTVWIPLGDITIEEGTLMVCPGTHNLEAFRELHESYGKLDVDRDVPGDPRASGHLTNHPVTWEPKESHTQCWDTKLASIPPPARQEWVTSDMAMGDVVIFGIKTLHMSTTNTTDRFRISCDTRWQPADHAVDERWQGSPTDGERHRFFIGDEPVPEGDPLQLGAKAAKRAALAAADP